MLLLGPALPQLFQGQEFGSTPPFMYFADHDGDLAAAVEAGRRQFLTQFPGLAQPSVQEQVPRPSDREAFARCALLDAERDADGPLRRLHRDLLRLRRSDPVLRDLGTDRVRIESSAPDVSVLVLRFLSELGDRLVIVNLGSDHQSPMNEPLFAPPLGLRWTVLWSSEDPSYDGGGAVPFVGAGRWLLQGRTALLLAST